MDAIRRIETPAGTLLYELTRKKVKNFNLRVRADGTVAVSVPPRAGLGQVDNFVGQRAEWIFEALGKMERRCGADESQGMLLGKPVPLMIKHGGQLQIWAEAGRLHLVLPQGVTAAAAMDSVRHGMAQPVFQRAMNLARGRFEALPATSLHIRAMKSRWGSCIPARGKITLNTHLMKKPFDCIEYVAVHELCHLMAPNHGAEFYQWMDQALPDHRQRKNRLNEPDLGI